MGHDRDLAAWVGGTSPKAAMLETYSEDEQYVYRANKASPMPFVEMRAYNEHAARESTPAMGRRWAA